MTLVHQYTLHTVCLYLPVLASVHAKLGFTFIFHFTVGPHVVSSLWIHISFCRRTLWPSAHRGVWTAVCIHWSVSYSHVNPPTAMNVYCSLKSDASCITPDLVPDEMCSWHSTQLKVTGLMHMWFWILLWMGAELKNSRWMASRKSCATVSLRVQSTVDGFG